MDLKIEHLEKAGFKKVHNRFEENIGLRGDLYLKRIHDLIYLEINLDDNFATLVRKSETKLHVDRITIPRPVKTKKELNALLKALVYNTRS